MRATARDLVGRKIVSVEFRLFNTGIGRGRSTNPVITLDNGRRLSFVVEETEVGEYGINLELNRPNKREAES